MRFRAADDPLPRRGASKLRKIAEHALLLIFRLAAARRAGCVEIKATAIHAARKDLQFKIEMNATTGYREINGPREFLKEPAITNGIREISIGSR